MQETLLGLVDSFAANRHQLQENAEPLGSIFNALLECGFGGEYAVQENNVSPDDTTKDFDERLATRGSFTLVHPKVCAIAVRLVLHLQDYTPRAGLHAFRLVATAARADERSRTRLWQSGLLSDLLHARFDRAPAPDLAGVRDELITALIGLGMPSSNDAATMFQKACDSDEARSLLLQIAQESKGPAFIQFDSEDLENTPWLSSIRPEHSSKYTQAAACGYGMKRYQVRLVLSTSAPSSAPRAA